MLIIIGFVGARLTYVFFNFNAYKNNLFHILTLSHMNLNFAGGVISGFFTLYFLAKRYKILLYNLVKIYIVPFYFSMAIGVWTMYFDGLLIGKENKGLLSIEYMGKNRHLVVIYLSVLFLIGIFIESIQFKKINKYITYITIILIMIFYYVLKIFFTM